MNLSTEPACHVDRNSSSFTPQGPARRVGDTNNSPQFPYTSRHSISRYLFGTDYSTLIHDEAVFDVQLLIRDSTVIDEKAGDVDYIFSRAVVEDILYILPYWGCASPNLLFHHQKRGFCCVAVSICPIGPMDKSSNRSLRTRPGFGLVIYLACRRCFFFARDITLSVRVGHISVLMGLLS